MVLFAGVGSTSRRSTCDRTDSFDQLIDQASSLCQRIPLQGSSFDGCFGPSASTICPATFGQKRSLAATAEYAQNLTFLPSQ